MKIPNPSRRGRAGSGLRGIALAGLLAWAGGFVPGMFRATAAEPAERTSLILVVGAPGDEEFGHVFEGSARRWQEAGTKGGAKITLIGVEAGNGGSGSDRERFQGAIEEELKSKGGAELWVVLIGHGTFDGKEAKFNLRGSDVSATELAGWLKPCRRPLAVINTASASGPFLAKLSATNRVIITATRSGHEVNFARFGVYISGALADPDADLDKDGQTSLLEAFLAGARRTMDYYEGEDRLATEHALLDDDGDGLGTPPEWFRGVRAIKRAKDGGLPDGLRAHQFHLVRRGGDVTLSAAARARRDELELAVARLRDLKKSLDETEYYRRLEVLLVEMARIYEQAEQPEKSR
jgi:hypothetical protein